MRDFPLLWGPDEGSWNAPCHLWHVSHVYIAPRFVSDDCAAMVQLWNKSNISFMIARAVVSPCPVGAVNTTLQVARSDRAT